MTQMRGTGMVPTRFDEPPHAVWMIRAGGKGEAEQLCLDQGICGIGWPDLPNLSGMDEEAVNKEIDKVYGGELAGRIRNHKMQIGHFRSIANGDLVLLPLKTNPDHVAVGRVTGPYEYRLDLPELTRHVRPLQWLSRNVSKEALQPIKRSLDRPLTISPTPATSDQIDRVLSGYPLPPYPDSTNRRFAGSLEEALDEMGPDGSKDGLSHRISETIPEILRDLIGDERPVTFGLGIGRSANVPWVAVHAVGSPGASEEGIYAVYLFAADGSAVYLSLNQGTEKVRGGLNPLIKRARDIRAASGFDTAGASVELSKKSGRPARYQAASAYAVKYEPEAVPDDEELLDDLREVLSAIDRALERGLELDPQHEPIHLAFKWSADFESQTVALHRVIAEEKGSVWWGKFGSGERSIGQRRLEQITDQLKAGIETYAFLYGGGELIRTRLRAITTDPGEVEDDLRPTYYEKSDCTLFVRLDEFETQNPDWLLEHTVLASEPMASPEEMSKALGNQTTPLFIYELGGEGEIGAPTPPSLDMPWLIASTYWSEPELNEILTALEERGQVILAGPPGTGKTWIAEHLARYLTDDQPLRRSTVQLHPSYGYEEFVEGLRPVANDDGGISFKRRNGVILRMAEEMQDSDEIRVLVVDELNRANIPRVFGELLYLLEYRDKSIDLQFSRDFELPRNLKVIATMNTADRSTRSIDIALRRRFEIFDCPPRSDILEAYYSGASASTTVSNLIAGFAKLNSDLTANLDRHHTVGHSFFMRDVYTAQVLRRTWDRQIRPLLEDYFFDQEDLVEDFKQERYWPDH